MNLEVVKKLKTCKSVEELLAIAKEYGIQITAEQAAEQFAKLKGLLSDDQLENVAGGIVKPTIEKPVVTGLLDN